jgi:hypothetical protein
MCAASISVVIALILLYLTNWPISKNFGVTYTYSKPMKNKLLDLSGQFNRHNVRMWEDVIWKQAPKVPKRESTFHCWLCSVVTRRFRAWNLGGISYAEFRKKRALMIHYSGKPPYFHVEFPFLLDENFPCKWIDRGVPVTWTPHSPDLTASELFFRAK